MSITDFVTKMQAYHLDPAAIAAFRDAYAQSTSPADEPNRHPSAVAVYE
jgi:hypothetical protein